MEFDTSVTEVDNLRPINIDQATTHKNTIYLRAESLGHIKEHVILEVDVCSDEAIVSSGTTNLSREFIYASSAGVT